MFIDSIGNVYWILEYDRADDRYLVDLIVAGTHYGDLHLFPKNSWRQRGWKPHWCDVVSTDVFVCPD